MRQLQQQVASAKEPGLTGRGSREQCGLVVERAFEHVARTRHLTGEPQCLPVANAQLDPPLAQFRVAGFSLQQVVGEPDRFGQSGDRFGATRRRVQQREQAPFLEAQLATGDGTARTSRQFGDARRGAFTGRPRQLEIERGSHGARLQVGQRHTVREERRILQQRWVGGRHGQSQDGIGLGCGVRGQSRLGAMVAHLGTALARASMRQAGPILRHRRMVDDESFVGGDTNGQHLVHAFVVVAASEQLGDFTDGGGEPPAEAGLHW
jgi:hypothetical protein